MTLPKPSEKRIERLQKEGRGRGEGRDYKPWFNPMEMSSRGLSHRVHSLKTGRNHGYVSDGELDFHFMLDWASAVVDIREQYPLSRLLTRQAALELGVRHPCYPTTQIEMVMTVDFMATTLRDGELTLEAYDVKHASGLDDLRTLEKLEITRSVLAEMGISHYLVSHAEIPKQKVMNLKWIHQSLPKTGEDGSAAGLLEELAARMLDDLPRASKYTKLNDYCASFEQRVGASDGLGLRAAKILMHRRHLLPDLAIAELHAAPIGSFSIAHEALEQQRAYGGAR